MYPHHCVLQLWTLGCRLLDPNRFHTPISQLPVKTPFFFKWEYKNIYLASVFNTARWNIKTRLGFRFRSLRTWWHPDECWYTSFVSQLKWKAFFSFSSSYSLMPKLELRRLTGQSTSWQRAEKNKALGGEKNHRNMGEAEETLRCYQ